MDERTRRTDDELAPNLRRTVPEPDARSRTYSKVKTGIGLIIAIGLVAGAYEIVQLKRAPPATNARFQGGGLQSVGVATVGTGDIRVLVNALGTVTPLATVTVQTQISGQLTAVGFTEGQNVKKGDFLAQIDERPYAILKAQYEGQLAHDQGLLDQARSDLKRYQTLLQQNSIARQQADNQVFIVQQYEGTVKLDQAQIDAQVLNIAYCHIVSPVTGRVGLRLVDPGNYVQTSSSSNLAVVTQLQPITVVFSVPEDDLPDIMPSFTAGTALQVTAFDRANVRQLATGQVSAVDNQVDTTTGTVKVRAQFDNADNVLFPNQFVNVQLLVKTLHNVVTVPTAAIQRGSPGAYVYLINADGTVSVRNIAVGPTDTTGPHGDSMTAIDSGLAAGDKVVIDGADRLRDGLKVNVVSDSAQNPVGANAPGGGSRRGGGSGGGGGGGGGGQNPGRTQNPRPSNQ